MQSCDSGYGSALISPIHLKNKKKPKRFQWLFEKKKKKKHILKYILHNNHIVQFFLKYMWRACYYAISSNSKSS